MKHKPFQVTEKRLKSATSFLSRLSKMKNTAANHYGFKVGDKVRPAVVSDGVITKLLSRSRVEIQTEQDGIQIEPSESIMSLKLDEKDRDKLELVLAKIQKEDLQLLEKFVDRDSQYLSIKINDWISTM